MLVELDPVICQLPNLKQIWGSSVYFWEFFEVNFLGNYFCSRSAAGTVLGKIFLWGGGVPAARRERFFENF
jgi:hypothetical protein